VGVRGGVTGRPEPDRKRGGGEAFSHGRALASGWSCKRPLASLRGGGHTGGGGRGDPGAGVYVEGGGDCGWRTIRLRLEGRAGSPSLVPGEFLSFADWLLGGVWSIMTEVRSPVRDVGGCSMRSTSARSAYTSMIRQRDPDSGSPPGHPSKKSPTSGLSLCGVARTCRIHGVTVRVGSSARRGGPFGSPLAVS
jgi:hypothetical protein